MTAAPATARSKIACLIDAAADASTPHVGWLMISTSGSCKISRPMTNFCKLPPDSDRAVLPALGVRTSNFSIISAAKSRARSHFRKPRDDSSLRTLPVSSAFSISVMSGAAAWPLRSSGAAHRPNARRAFGGIWPISSSPMRTIPELTRISPDKAATSSSCPLPATPPTPKTSPRRTVREISRNAVPNSCGAGADSPVRVKATSPAGLSGFSGTCSTAPTISSAISRADVWRGSHSPTTWPIRNTVAWSHKARISSSLCEIYKIDVPSDANLRRVSNKIVTSCGVRTDVGSSMISNLGS